MECRAALYIAGDKQNRISAAVSILDNLLMKVLLFLQKGEGQLRKVEGPHS